MGQGLTTRPGVEFCLLARYGKLGRQDKGVAQVIFSPKREHSRKPDEQYPLIERFVGPGKYLEFFARHRRPGWDQVYSAEADSGPGQRRWRANSYPETAQSPRAEDNHHGTTTSPQDKTPEHRTA